MRNEMTPKNWSDPHVASNLYDFEWLENQVEIRQTVERNKKVLH